MNFKMIMYGALIFAVGIIACLLMIRYNGRIYTEINNMTNRTLGININNTIDSFRFGRIK